jgi:hypothetical protein
MPSSLSMTLLIFGLILAVSHFATVAVIAGCLALAWEAFLFYKTGT